MANYHAYFFNSNAKKELKKATKVLGLEFDTAIQPYYTVGYHATASLYPFANAVKCFMSAGRIVVGAFLCLDAIFNNPTKAIPRVLGGLAFEVGVFIINAMNTVITIITLITRTLATIFNSGYLSPNLLQSTVGILTGESNAPTPLIDALSSEATNTLAKQREDALYQESFSF